MATKKKVDNEAGDTPEVVDTEAVETPDVDSSESVDTEPISTPVEVLVDGSLATAQRVLGVPSTGEMNHATKMALRKYQRENGLSPSGRFDAITKGRMNL